MSKTFWNSPSGILALMMIGAVSYFLLMEHREHLFQALPYLILLACPLMHVFMHGSHGHGGHGHGDGHADPDRSAEEAAYHKGLKEGRRLAREHENHEDRG